MESQHGSVSSGETVGRDQEPVEAGDHDATQREAEGREPRRDDPAQPEVTSPDALQPDPQAADERFAQSPDRAYGQRDEQAAEDEPA